MRAAQAVRAALGSRRKDLSAHLPHDLCAPAEAARAAGQKIGPIEPAGGGIRWPGEHWAEGVPGETLSQPLGLVPREAIPGVPKLWARIKRLLKVVPAWPAALQAVTHETGVPARGFEQCPSLGFIQGRARELLTLPCDHVLGIGVRPFLDRRMTQEGHVPSPVFLLQQLLPSEEHHTQVRGSLFRE